MGLARSVPAAFSRPATATGDSALSAARPPRIGCFAPLGAADARCLILGTMPGKASLAATQYYAHPRNAFWPIMERLHGVPGSASYAERVAALEQAGLALWDVLASCVRGSSLDADIDTRSAQPNDFGSFLARQPRIEKICFNGAPARRLFDRLVLPRLTAHQQSIMRLTLPSTSPANARLSFEQKLAAWAAAQTATR